MKVERTAECSLWRIQHYFSSAISKCWTANLIFGLLESRRFTQIYCIRISNLQGIKYRLHIHTLFFLSPQILQSLANIENRLPEITIIYCTNNIKINLHNKISVLLLMNILLMNTLNNLSPMIFHKVLTCIVRKIHCIY